MDSIYHPGERKVQREAGAIEVAASMERRVLPVLAHLYVNFIQSQPYVFLGTVAADGNAWGSILSGAQGFMRVRDEQTLWIGALPDKEDPLGGDFRDDAQIGLLLLDFSTRRRLRINGSVRVGAEGFAVSTRQVYTNCTRYIQSRRCELADAASPRLRKTCRATSLTPDQRERIGNADTFFLATGHPEGGADISHRGGFPGFVQAVDAETIVWPEYNGNGMFNSLGNLVENPACGLLFLDFETGGTLQLSGNAKILSERERTASIPGAERLLEFHITKIVETGHATALRWSFLEHSPDNPWFC